MTGLDAPGRRTRRTSTVQDAVRLLLLINATAEALPVPPPAEAPTDAVAVLRSQVLLQKLDFWLRNPDYLADELLTRYETSGDTIDLDLARSILLSDEPEIRSYPMLRYLYGAYEELDAPLSYLAAPRLVLHRRRARRMKHGPGTAQRDYYLTVHGRSVAQQIIADVPELAYYAERAVLVNDLAAGRRGSALRDVQYLQETYRNAALHEPIVGIAAVARERLAKIEESRGMTSAIPAIRPGTSGSPA